MTPDLPLPIVDGCALDDEVRGLLCPDAEVTTQVGTIVRRPRYYYEVDSWETARKIELTPHFALWEFIDVDVRETRRLRGFPRYVPCAVAVLAFHLELLRAELGSPVRIAANGGFRSPALAGGHPLSLHTWGTAANIYRIGDEYLDEREAVERYASVVRRILPTVWCRPYGGDAGQTLDHLHVDLGHLVSVPHR